jgi:hypothetical protein
MGHWRTMIGAAWAKLGGGDAALGKARALGALLALLTLLSATGELLWDDSSALEAHGAWGRLWGPYAIDPAAYWRPVGVAAMEWARLLGVSNWWWTKAQGPLIWAVGLAGALRLAAGATPSGAGRAREAALMAVAAGLGALAMSAEPQLWISSRFDALLCALAPWAACRAEAIWREKTPSSAGRLALRLAEGALWAALLAGSKETGAVWSVALGGWAALRFMGARSERAEAAEKGALMERALRLAQEQGASRDAIELIEAQAAACQQEREGRERAMRQLAAWASGLAAGLLGWWLVRRGVLTHAANVEELMGQRGGLPLAARGALFAEGSARTLLGFFAPWADAGPVKAHWAAWPEAGGLAQGAAALALWLAALAGCARQAWRERAKAVAAAPIALGAALGLALFHAGLAAFAEQSNGALLADRYLAPSAIMCAPALALVAWAALGGRGPAGGAIGAKAGAASQGAARAAATKRAALMAVGLFWIWSQGVAWTQAREPWTSSLALWSAAQQSAPEVKLASINLALAYNALGQPAGAAAVAEGWIAAHGGPKLENCRLYSNAMHAELTMRRMAQAAQLAKQSAPFAWCDPGLASAAGALLALDPAECPAAREMLDKALKEGAGGPGSRGFWRFRSDAERGDLLARRAFAEARCGEPAKTESLLDELAKADPHFARGSKMRQSLLDQARSLPQASASATAAATAAPAPQTEASR